MKFFGSIKSARWTNNVKRISVYRYTAGIEIRLSETYAEGEAFELKGSVLLTHKQVLLLVRNLLISVHSVGEYRFTRVTDTSAKVEVHLEKWAMDDAVYFGIYTHDDSAKQYVGGMFVTFPDATTLIDCLLKAIQPTWWQTCAGALT